MIMIWVQKYFGPPNKTMAEVRALQQNPEDPLARIQRSEERSSLFRKFSELPTARKGRLTPLA